MKFICRNFWIKIIGVLIFIFAMFFAFEDAPEFREIFNAVDKKADEHYLQMSILVYARFAQRFSIRMVENLAEDFSVSEFQFEHQRSIKSSNILERIKREICRRTKVVWVFPNGQSCLRLVSTCLMEVSEEWQICKCYCAGMSIDYLRTMGVLESNLQKKCCRIKFVWAIN